MKQFSLLLFLIFLFSCNSVNDNGEKDYLKAVSRKSINRSKYELQYPSDWKINTADKDFDIDGYFSIEAPEDNALSMFFIFNTSINEEEYLEDQVQAQLNKTLKNGQVLYFDHWGSFTGHGAVIKGKFLGVSGGELKIFCHSNDSASFLTVTQYLNKHEEEVMPGFRLIETSFKLKK